MAAGGKQQGVSDGPNSRNARTDATARSAIGHTNKNDVLPLAAAACMEAPKMNDDVNVLALVKGKERYILLYDDSQQAEALRALGRQASDPELSFSWYDAAVLSRKVRSEAKRNQATNRIASSTK